MDTNSPLLAPLVPLNMTSVPKVFVTTNPVVASTSPAAMCYGGVERVAYIYAAVFAECGLQVIPVAPQNSEYPFEVSKEHRWPEDALCTPGRIPKPYAEDVLEKWTDYAKFVAELVDTEEPDAILMLGPPAVLLEEIEATRPDLVSRSIVSFRNGPKDNDDALLRVLDRHPDIVLTALTARHLRSLQAAFTERGFPGVSERIRLIRDGVLVEGHVFEHDPSDVRSSVEWDLAEWDFGRNGRRVVSHVDYFSSNKGQMMSFEIFRRAALYELGYDLVLGGGLGWQLPSRTDSGDGSAERSVRYLRRLVEMVAESGLQDHVHFLGPLPGAAVQLLNRGSDFVVVPVRMDHGDLWPGTEGQDPEAHGLAVGHAIATGTPTLCSHQIQETRVLDGVTGARFDSVDEGARLARELAERCLSSQLDRRRVRAFAEQNESVEEAVTGYLQLVQAVIARSGTEYSPISARTLHDALERVGGAERDSALRVLQDRHWLTETQFTL